MILALSWAHITNVVREWWAKQHPAAEAGPTSLKRLEQRRDLSVPYQINNPRESEPHVRGQQAL